MRRSSTRAPSRAILKLAKKDIDDAAMWVGCHLTKSGTRPKLDQHAMRRHKGAARIHLDGERRRGCAQDRVASCERSDLTFRAREFLSEPWNLCTQQQSQTTANNHHPLQPHSTSGGNAISYRLYHVTLPPSCLHHDSSPHTDWPANSIAAPPQPVQALAAAPACTLMLACRTLAACTPHPPLSVSIRARNQSLSKTHHQALPFRIHAKPLENSAFPLNLHSQRIVPVPTTAQAPPHDAVIAGCKRIVRLNGRHRRAARSRQVVRINRIAILRILSQLGAFTGDTSLIATVAVHTRVQQRYHAIQDAQHENGPGQLANPSPAADCVLALCQWLAFFLIWHAVWLALFALRLTPQTPPPHTATHHGLRHHAHTDWQPALHGSCKSTSNMHVCMGSTVLAPLAGCPGTIFEFRDALRRRSTVNRSLCYMRN
ncbi:hypothetical protein PWT90_09563 [Aphanocladium album]|nr:hypothetical protein PWT90_09563 [Aphanocladium album]